MVAHGLYCKQIYSYNGMLESLSGASVDVQFISFSDIMEHGIPSDIDVIINAGDAETAFSGGSVWDDSKLVSMVREWIYNGGGFVGIGEPAAYEKGGHFFQLADALGLSLIHIFLWYHYSTLFSAKLLISSVVFYYFAQNQ